MIFEITIDKLKKFENQLGFDFQINEEKVLDLLSSSSLPKDAEYEENINLKIAEQLCNRESIVIDVDLNSNNWFNDDNKAKYQACLIAEKTDIKINLTANIKDAKEKFEITLESDVKHEDLESSKVDWTIDEQILKSKWENPEYVFSKINASNVIQNLDLIPDEFWNEENTRKIFEKFNFSISYKEILKEIIKKQKTNIYILREIKDKDVSLLSDLLPQYENYIKSKKTINKEMEEIEKKLETNYFVVAIINNNNVFNEYEKYIKKEVLYSEDVLSKFYKDSYFLAFKPFEENSKHWKVLMKKPREFKESLFFKILNSSNNTTPYSRLSFLIEDIYKSNAQEIRKFIEKIPGNSNIEQLLDELIKAKRNKKTKIKDEDFLDIILDIMPLKFLSCNELQNEENILKFLNKSDKINTRSQIYFNGNILNKIENIESIKKIAKAISNEQIIGAYGKDIIKNRDILSTMLEKEEYFFWSKKKTKEAIEIIENDEELLRKYVLNCNTQELSDKARKSITYIIASYERENNRGIEKLSKIKDIVIDKKLITKELYMSLIEVTEGLK